MSLAETADEIAEAFDEIRTELWGEQSKLVLLRIVGTDKPYVIIGEIRERWDPGPQAGAGPRAMSVASTELRIRIADLSMTTADMIGRSTHAMLVDTDLEALNNMVWLIKRGTTPPIAVRPYWILRVVSEGRRYFPPTEVEA